jgi:hypothetical protein
VEGDVAGGEREREVEDPRHEPDRDEREKQRQPAGQRNPRDAVRLAIHEGLSQVPHGHVVP